MLNTKNNKILTYLLITAGIVLLAAVIIILIGLSGGRKLGNQLKLGDKYLSEFNFEPAIIAFTEALKIDERNVEAYSGLATTYKYMGDAAYAAENVQEALSLYGEGLSTAQKGYDMTGDSGLLEMVNEFKDIIEDIEDSLDSEAETVEPEGAEAKTAEQENVTGSNFVFVEQFWLAGDYETDSNGFYTRISDALTLENNGTSYTSYRIKRLEFDDGEDSIYYEESGTFDGHGNIISKQCGETMSNLAETDTYTYTYSEDGKILTREAVSDNALSHRIESRVYNYDEDGLLISIEGTYSEDEEGYHYEGEIDTITFIYEEIDGEKVLVERKELLKDITYKYTNGKLSEIVMKSFRINYEDYYYSDSDDITEFIFEGPTYNWKINAESEFGASFEGDGGQWFMMDPDRKIDFTQFGPEMEYLDV